MNNIISIRLMGGLGNQLFQYATAYAISKHYKKEMVLDTRFFAKYNLHGGYRLDKFNITARTLNSNEYSHFPSWQIKLLEIFPKLTIIFDNWLLEESFNFQSITIKTEKPINLVGYWQSDKYFSKYKTQLKNEFSLKNKLNKKYCKYFEKIIEDETVAIHIRRGDYISNPQALVKHGLCSIGYYKIALELLKEKLKNPKFFFFSDDITWTEREFSSIIKDYQCTYISGGTAEDDFWLMVNARNHVIANSTFSWWAAWLADHEDDGVVICPQPWLEDKDINTDDLIPDDWIKINKHKEL